MMILKVSESTAARRRIPLVLVDNTDGVTPETGITFSAGELKLSKNGAAEGNHAGTVTELAGGVYYYEATSGELDTVGFLTVRTVKTGVRQFVAAAQIVSIDPYDSVRAGLTALPNAAADAAGGLPISDAGGLDLDSIKSDTAAILTDTADIQPKIGTPAGASVSADIAAVKAQTAAIETDTQDIQNRLPAALVGGRLSADVQSIDGQATNGYNATLKLKQLDIENTTGVPLRIVTGATGNAITVTAGAAGACIGMTAGAFGISSTPAWALNGIAISTNVVITGNLTVNGATGLTIPNGITANITGNVTGSVSSVTGNVGGSVASVTGNVGGSVASVVGSIGGNVLGSIGSLAAQAKADVNAEMDSALADVNLDHLVGTAAGIPAIVAGTYLDQIMDDGTAAFDRTTDSLQAIRDRGDGSWTGLDAAGVRSAIGLAAANLDTQLSAIDDYLDTEVAAIKVKTDQLNFTGTDVKATLDGETVTASTVTDKTGYALAVDGMNLPMQQTVGGLEAGAAKESLVGAVLKLTARVRINGSTLEVYGADGTTLFASQTITSDSALDPIKEVGNPA